MKTNETLTPYHLAMVIAGQYLNQSGNSSITPRILQNELLQNIEIGYRLPFSVCIDSLELLKIAGFIRESGKEVIAGTSYPAYSKC